jgi:hypothetical protein
MARYSQKPGPLDIELVFGDSLSALLTFKKAGLPWDISTYTIVGLTSESGLSFTFTPVDLASGQVNISMSASDTAKLISDETWTCVFSRSGEKNTELKGKVYSV